MEPTTVGREINTETRGGNNIMLTKTEQDKWIVRAAIESLRVLQDEVLMIAGETQESADVSFAFYALHANIDGRIKDLEDKLNV